MSNRNELTDKQIEALQKVAIAFERGYLNERKLESAIHAISNHHSGYVWSGLIVLTIAVMFTTGFLPFKPKTQVLPKMPEISINKVQSKKPDSVILQANHHDGKGYVFDINLLSKNSDRGVGIPSPCDGVIAKSEWLDGYGWTIATECPNGIRYFMAHLDKQSLQAGTKVIEGQIIGIQGKTGNSTGYHVHLEFSKAGTDTLIRERYIALPLAEEYVNKIKN